MNLHDFTILRSELMNEVENLEPTLLTRQPRNGGWSIMEVVEHLVISERQVFLQLPSYSTLIDRRPTPEQHIRRRMVMLLLNVPVRISIPSQELAPTGGRTVRELSEMWDESQDWLRGCIEFLGPTRRMNSVLLHPIAGPLTVDQGLALGSVHVRRHTKQINRILKEHRRVVDRGQA